MNKVYTAQEVADKLKIKKSTVYDLIKRGELSSSKVGKQLRVSEEQLSQYLKGSECSASSAQSYDHQPESSLLKRDYLLHSSGLIISGQCSPALDLLLNQLPTHPDNLPVLQSHMNTYNGLYSLYFEKVHIACASASPEDIHSLIPGIPLTVISLCQYPVGFYVKKENPKNIRGFSDLTRADIIFVNREKGSSRRILLDRTLLSSEISPDSISGYRNELVTDHSTAAAVGWRTGRHSSWRGLCSEKLSGAGFSSCLPGITLPGYADQKSEHPRLSGRSGNHCIRTFPPVFSSSNRIRYY